MEMGANIAEKRWECLGLGWKVSCITEQGAWVLSLSQQES